MKHFLYTLLAACAVTITSIDAKIIETMEIADILESVEEGAWYMFDVGDTLINSSKSQASKEQIKNFWANLPKKERPKAQISQFLKQNATIKPMEKQTKKVIKQLQEIDHLVVVGLTARHPAKPEHYKETVTAIQLRHLGMDFNESNFPEEFKSHPDFEGGLFYTSGKKKGKFLRNILEMTGVTPAKVVFVDDNLGQIKAVDETCAELGIPCDCYWYRRVEKA